MAETLTYRLGIKPDIFLFIAIIYFFLNCLFLPQGIQYTTFLTPLFLWVLYKDKVILPFIWFLLLTDLFAVIHFVLGVEPYFYIRSWLMAFCSFTFALAVYDFLKNYPSPEKLIEKIALINIIIIPIALASLLIHPLNEYFWYYKPISPGVKSFPRLQMLTYEASYYSLLFSPVFIYYLLKIMFNKSSNIFFNLAIVMVPLILSLSFGVIAIIGITIAAVFIMNFKNIIDSKRKLQWLIYIVAGFIVLSILVLFCFPDNPVSHRVFNVLNNKDTSIRGRTYEAFHLARWIASEKSMWFGVGFGQIKVIGHDIIVKYYQYYEPHPVVRIPNTLAETLAMFGYLGLLIRLVVEVYLFISTKVYLNIYRTAIFIFIFIYQFTGSFMFNIAELVLWVIAFTPSFTSFDRDKLNKNVAP